MHVQMTSSGSAAVSRATPGAVTDSADIPDSMTDAALIAAVRGGDNSAFGVLYRRHLVNARRVAAACAANGAERDDVVAEAFSQVLRILRSGRGPDVEFRPYLLATIRNTVITLRRRESTTSLYADVPEVAPPAGYSDPVAARLHGTVAAAAFANLPERWRIVLWHTEIEGEAPADVAPILGMTPNSVSALAYRAREGLKQAYLEQHLPVIEQRACQTIVCDLPGWARHRLTRIKARRIDTHLECCTDCRELATEIRQLNQELSGVVAPLILGIPLTLASLPAAGSTASSGVALTGLSWLTSLKTAFAGAAIVTTAVVGSVASSPVPPPGSVENGHGLAASAPQEPQNGQREPRVPGAGAPQPSPIGFTDTPGAPDEVAVGPDAAQPAASTPVSTSKVEKQQQKTAAKDAKQEAKEAKKEAKAETKEERKSGKGAATSSTKPK